MSSWISQHFLRPVSFFQRPKLCRYRSMAEVLSTFLSRRQMEDLINSTPDRRFLVARASELLGVDQGVLLERIASRLKIESIARIEPIDPSLSGSRNLAELRQIGAIVISTGGLLRAIACVDPWRIAALQEELPGLPVYLATWHDIAHALDQSEKKLIEFRKEQESTRQQKSERVAKQVLALVIDEASKFKSEQLLISFEADQIEYSFNRTNGRRAEGTISEQIRAALYTVLQSAVSSEQASLQLELGSSCLKVCIEQLYQQQLFTLSWGSVSGKSKESGQRTNPLPEKGIVKPQALTRKRRKKTIKTDRQLVVVIEDNSTFATVLKRFLLRKNIEVEHAANGRAALDLVARIGGNTIGLILCDVHMPEMNGFEFLRQLRKLPDFCGTPVIMLTSDEDLETELRALGDGADAFVPKSRDPRVLYAHIERQLERGAKAA